MELLMQAIERPVTIGETSRRRADIQADAALLRLEATYPDSVHYLKKSARTKYAGSRNR